MKNPDGICTGDSKSCNAETCCARKCIVHSQMYAPFTFASCNQGTCDSWMDECPTVLNRLPDNTICASGTCNVDSCCTKQSWLHFISLFRLSCPRTLETAHPRLLFTCCRIFVEPTQGTCGEWGRLCDRLTPPESPKPDTKCRGNCSAGVCCLSKCLVLFCFLYLNTLPKG